MTHPLFQRPLRRTALALALAGLGFIHTTSQARGVPGDFNADGVPDLAIGVPGENLNNLPSNDPKSLLAAGAVHVLYGERGRGLNTRGNQLWHQDVAGILGTAQALDRFGSTLASGDFNGDGAADLLIGAPGEAIPSTGLAVEAGAGAVHVLYGRANVGLHADGNQVWHQNIAGLGAGAERGDAFGSALATGDFNHDGFDDVAIGVPNEAIGEEREAGAVQVLYGSAAGLVASGAQLWHAGSPGLADHAARFHHFGAAVAAGDFNGDGFADLAIGVPQATQGDFKAATSTGVVHVLLGGSTGLVSDGHQFLHQGLPDLVGSAAPGNRFGSALAAADFDHDGLDDLAIGAPGTEAERPAFVPPPAPGQQLRAGVVHVLRGASSGLTTQGNLQIDAGPNPRTGTDFGAVLATGDLNGDGFADLVVGAPGHSRLFDATAQRVGRAEKIFGSADGLLASSRRVISQDGLPVDANTGEGEANDRFGSAIAVGDYNGDGLADTAVGAPGETFTTDGDVASRRDLPAAGTVSVIYSFNQGQPISAATRYWNQGDAEKFGSRPTEQTIAIPGLTEAGDAFGASLNSGGAGSSTITAPTAGLSGRWKSLAAACGSGDSEIIARLQVNNPGLLKAPRSVLRVFLSADARLDDGDTLLASRTLPALPATTVRDFRLELDAAGGCSSEQRLIGVLDATDRIAESNEDNNLLVSPRLR